MSLDAQYLAERYPQSWIITNGDTAIHVPTLEATGRYFFNFGRSSATFGDQSVTLSAGWWIYRVPVSLPPSQQQDPELDKATAALVYSSVPKYRNSDRCPKPLCGKQGVFKQMHLVCPTHGAFHT